MRLLLLGLACLVVDVLGQKYDTVFSELPFGARIPGYENPIAAYSYTIRERSPNQKDNHDLLDKKQLLVKLHDNKTPIRKLDRRRLHAGNSFKHFAADGDFASANVQFNKLKKAAEEVTLNHSSPPSINQPEGRLKVANKDRSKKFTATQHLEKNADTSFLDTSATIESTSLQNRKLQLISNNSSDKTIDDNVRALKLSLSLPEQSSEDASDSSGLYFKPHLPNEILFDNSPLSSQKSNSNKEESSVSYASHQESSSPKERSIDDSYSPPMKISETEVLQNSYLPPTDPFEEVLPTISYLPPQESKLIEPTNSYLPPEHHINVEVPDNSYLPPKKTIEITVPDTSYLPPEEGIETQLPDLSYLPPKSTADVELSDNTGLLPRQTIAVTFELPAASYVSPVTFKDNYDSRTALPKPVNPILSGKVSENVRKYKPKVSSRKIFPNVLESRIVNNPITPIRGHQNYQIVQKYQSPIRSAANGHRFCNYDSNCRSNEVCQDACCIDGCTVIRGTCTGNARCQTRRHIPSCVCPQSFVAQTVRGRYRTQYDCMAMPLTIAAVSKHTERAVYRQNSPARPIDSPVRLSRPTVSRPQSFFNRVSGNPCSPSPCGDNTRCDVNQRSGIAQCRCVDGYIPDDHTIKGCKPQCTRDDDCPDDYKCDRQSRCERVCQRGVCGLHADCEARNHRARCRCPTGYVGNPDVTCKFEVPEVRAPPEYPIDLCSPNPCGFQADCRVRGDRPVCSCPIGSEGDPLSECKKGECIEHNDCSGHLACQSLRCIDPCQLNVCGGNADCVTRNHQPVCSCPRGHIGDPFVTCRRITEYDLCNPTPCGPGTNCKARSDRQTGDLRAVCSCIEAYIGDPLTGCRPECERDTDCSTNQGCTNNRCRNPCVKACGTDAYCDVVNHRASCRCHEFAIGNARTRCSFECTSHEECNDNQACSQQYKCIDPCDGACGTDANCEVSNHTPICSCPKTRTGDPFKFCRLFTLADLCADEPCGTDAECTPGKDRTGNDRPVCTCREGYIGNPLISCQRGDCQDHIQCPNTEACYQFQCQSPCFYRDNNFQAKSVCGENADCSVENHTPVCRCARGWTGDPTKECVIAPNARVAGSSSRRVSGSARFLPIDAHRYFK